MSTDSRRAPEFHVLDAAPLAMAALLSLALEEPCMFATKGADSTKEATLGLNANDRRKVDAMTVPLRALHTRLPGKCISPGRQENPGAMARILPIRIHPDPTWLRAPQAYGQAAGMAPSTPRR